MATTILAYVIKNKKPFPIQEDTEIVDNLCDWVLFNEYDWISLSKAEFSRRMGVAGNQVTRWCQAGMPELPDGRIPYMRAEGWLKEEREGWWNRHEQRLRNEVRQMIARMKLEEQEEALAGITADDLVPDPEPEPEGEEL